jgi:glutamate carboxypeptidase
LNAGNRINIIPDTASAIADMRMSDLSEIERVQNDAYNIVQKKLIPDTVVTVRVEYRRSPLSKNLASDDLAVMANKIYQELGKSIEPVMARYGTDAGFAYNTKGSKPWILEGLGIIGERIHSSEESADLDSVTPRLYLTVRMLELLTQNIPGT